MTEPLRVHTLTIDCTDAAVVARFWSALLGLEVVPNHTDSIATRHPGHLSPPMLFTWADGAKAGKNRLHLDLRPMNQAAAVERALELGARTVDIGQRGDESWVVLQPWEAEALR